VGSIPTWSFIFIVSDFGSVACAGDDTTGRRGVPGQDKWERPNMTD